MKVIAGDPFVQGKILRTKKGFGVGKVKDLLDGLIACCFGQHLNDPAGHLFSSERDNDPFAHDC